MAVALVHSHPPAGQITRHGEAKEGWGSVSAEGGVPVQRRTLMRTPPCQETNYP